MFFLATSLAQLAFSNTLCGIYSVLGLFVVGYVLYQHLHLRKTLQQWTQSWDRFREDCHHRIDDILQTQQDLETSLQAHDLSDLVAHLKVYSEPPAASVCAEQTIRLAQSHHVLLEESVSPPQPHYLWPLWALGLGLLGTLLGLLHLGMTEPFPVQAQPATVLWFTFLPKLTTTVWPLSCGIFAALLLCIPNHRKQHNLGQREIRHQQLHQELTTRIQRELYPHLAQSGYLTHSPKRPDIAEQPTQSVTIIQEMLTNAHTEQQLFWEKLITAWDDVLESHKTPPDILQSFEQQHSHLQAQMNAWVAQITQANLLLTSSMEQITRSFQPMEHTQQLFQERLALMLRQHEAMSLSLQTLITWEESLPEKLREVVKLSLQPAHRILQRSSQSLHQSMELVLERSTQERAHWRSELKQFTERLQILERMSQDTGQVLQELTQITQHLAEIAEHLRFRPRPIVHSSPDEASSVSLDQEIEQILEDLGHRPSDP